MKISAVIIAKNEGEMIGEALDSVSFCDEVIVIDNNSADRTKKIAEEKGAKVTNFQSDNFSEMRNFGKEIATSDWILYVDADERISPELKKSILSAIKTKQFSAFKILRKNFYLGRQWPKVEKMERLFLKSSLKEWKGQLHETPEYDGQIGELEGYLFHFTHRELGQMLDKTNIWSEIEAQERFKSGHPRMRIWRFLRVMTTAFLRSYILDRGFMAGTAGIVEAIYQSYSIFITYAKLWELQEKKK